MLQNVTIYVEADYEAMSQKAAILFAETVKENKNGVYGFATGSTPIGMYQALVQMHTKGEIDFSHITAFNLDEYYPIKQSDPQSYAYFMQKHLFNAINLPNDRCNIPNGEAIDPVAECIAYEDKIVKAGGIDLQILGIGVNGHIGFNEPAQSLTSTTHHVPLAATTIQSNARNFNSIDDVPSHALTMGIDTIMMARRILLLANGESKAAILKEALKGPITTFVPASLLQRHQGVTIVADKAAASLLIESLQ